MSDLPPPPSPPSGWPQQGPQQPGQWPGQEPGAPSAPGYGQQPPGAGPWGAPGGYGYGGQSAPGYAMAKAGFWIRFAAYIVDGIIVSLFSAPAQIAINAGPKEEYTCTTFSPGDFDGSSFGTDICERPTGGTMAIYWVLTLIAFIAGLIYYARLEGTTGQTVGKKVCSIRVVDINTGGPIGVGRGVGRYFARILSGIVCGLGYFWMLWDPQKQCWHDKLTSAVVVRT